MSVCVYIYIYISLSLSIYIYVCIYIYIYIYIYVCDYVDLGAGRPGVAVELRNHGHNAVLSTPNLPTNIDPTKIAWLELSGKSPMDMTIPTLKHNIMLESNPLKSTMLVGRLAVTNILHSQAPVRLAEQARFTMVPPPIQVIDNINISMLPPHSCKFHEPLCFVLNMRL